MRFTSKSELFSYMKFLRDKLEKSFRPDTALAGFTGPTPSGGQCAAVSIIVNKLIGGQLVSARPDGTSHWFNRIRAGDRYYDVDITGDQFGKEPVQIEIAAKLYAGTKVRIYEEVNEETLNRAKLLASDAGFESVVEQLEKDAETKSP